MIKFNWTKIFNVSEGNPTEILNIIAYIKYKPIPKNNYDKIKKYTKYDWDGDSYLINPQKVLSMRATLSEKQLAEYVALASFRNLADYKVTGRKTLSVYESPMLIESLKTNKLLSIDKGEIYFCWEETKH